MAIKEIERLEATQFFEEYYLFFAIKGQVLENIGDLEASRTALKRALALATNEKEKAYLSDKLARLTD